MKFIIKSVKFSLFVLLLLFAHPGTCNAQNLVSSNQLEEESIVKCPLVNGLPFIMPSEGHNDSFDSSNFNISSDKKVWKPLVIKYLNEMKYDLAIRCIDSVLEYDSSCIDLKAFVECIFQKSYAASIRDFNIAKKRKNKPTIKNSSYDFYIGLCNLQLNRFDTSLFYLNLSMQEKDEINKGQDCYLKTFYMGVVYYEMSAYEKATEMFDRSLRKYPKFSDALFYKGLCLANIGNYRDALVMCNVSTQYLKEGYTISKESILEKYPYQISEYRIEPYLKRFEYVVQMLDKIKNNSNSK